MTQTRRMIVSELLSVADACRDPKTTAMVKARVAELLNGAKAWVLTDESIGKVLLSLEQIK